MIGLGVLIASIIIAYFIILGLPAVGLSIRDLVPRDITKHFDEPEEVVRAIQMIAALLVFGGFVDLFVIDGTAPYHDFSVEFIMVGGVVLVLDRMNEQRRKLEFKQQTFRQIRHSSNPFAIEALETARAMGWWDEIIATYTDLAGANLQGANLQGANLLGALFEKANLQESHLRGANLQEAVLVKVNLERADLRGANLQEAILWMANLQWVNLQAANLKGAGLSKANLHGAILWVAELQGATLRKANLQEADLRDANLQGAKYDQDTIWPDGFDPVAAGAILEER